MKKTAIILASGTGSRFSSELPKQFCTINDKSILEYSVEAFEFHNDIDELIIVSNPLFIDKTKEILNKNNYKKIIDILPGGKTRQESSYIGISAVKDSDSVVLIHDAVRPFVSSRIIDDCLEALKIHKAVNVAIESSDTIVQIDENNIIKSIPKRKTLRRCQTPQCFKYQIIKKAHELALNDKASDITDDCGLVVRYNLADIYTVLGSENNIKITYPIDLEIAKLILKNKEAEIL